VSCGGFGEGRVGAKALVSVFDVRQGLVQEVGDVGVVERVDDVAAAAITDDEPEMAQEAQLVRHGGLLHPQRAREFTDRVLPADEAAEDLHSAAGRERLHDLGDLAGQPRLCDSRWGCVPLAHESRLA
jgi:hypothetical protein